MTLLKPNHNYAADECIAQIPQHHIPTQEEKVRASEEFDKTVLTAAHMASLHDAYILEMATHPVEEVTIKPVSPTSSIGGLKPSTLKQLKVGKVHRKRVLNGTLCMKTLSSKSPSGLSAVNVFEDEEGNATPIYLSNALEENCGSAQAQKLFPQGSKVAVKEPYLTRLPGGEVILSVERPSDLVFLWVPDYEEPKGNDDGGKMEGLGEDGNGVGHANGVQIVEEKPAIGENSNGVQDADEQIANGNGHVEENVEAPAKTSLNGDKQEENLEIGSRGLSLDDLKKARNGNNQGDNNGEKADTQPAAAEQLEPAAETRVLNEGQQQEKEEEEVSTKGEEEEPPKTKSREFSLEDMMKMRQEGNKEEGEGGEEEAAAALRAKGNALFARGNYTAAADMYGRAAQKARRGGEREEEVMDVSNRAEAWLRLGRYGEALEEATAALGLLKEGGLAAGSGDGGKRLALALAKALFRQGRALMGLRRYQEALAALQEVLALAPSDRQLIEAATQCKDRIHHIVKPGKRQRLKKKNSSNPVGP